MHLTSAAFGEGEPIPVKFTGEGGNLSPPLQWTDVPANSRSLALIADDPDAPGGTWVHWILYDLPAEVSKLAEALPRNQYTPAGAKQGQNSFGHLGYGGPCPPAGNPHRYFFRLYALDSQLDLKPGATRNEVEEAMRGHVVAEARLMGTYRRR
jgi:Raf kinase inhibitor-like YbhB/YbcL family protein